MAEQQEKRDMAAPQGAAVQREQDPAPAAGPGQPPVVRRSAVMEVRLGDVVRLRKPHPCGSYEWQVVRLGADIGLKCQKCGHRVLLERAVFERRVKLFVSRGPAVGGAE